MSKVLIRFVLILNMVISLACNITSPFALSKSRKLNFPAAVYWRVGWLDNQLVAFVDSTSNDYSTPTNEIRYAAEGDVSVSSFLIDENAVCKYPPRYYVQSVIDGDTVQIEKSCFGDPKAVVTLLMYNWKDHSIEKQIGPVPLGSTLVFWNPDQTYGIVYSDDGFAKSTLYEMTKDGFGPLDVKIDDEGRSWNFKDFYPDFPDIQQTTGDIGRAGWSPDGKTIAFFASPDSVGKTGFERMGARYKIYIMDAATKTINPILDNIYYPYSIIWSPDAKHLAFMGHYRDSSSGVWLYSFTDSTVRKIDLGDFVDILWSEDSSSLIAIKCKGWLRCTSTDIIEYKIQ